MSENKTINHEEPEIVTIVKHHDKVTYVGSNVTRQSIVQLLQQTLADAIGDLGKAE
jgi:hypothetical protein